MLKRLFDIVFSLIGLIVLFPLLLILAIYVMMDSPGGIFFFQKRVGKNNVDFTLFKFRTMRTDSERHGQLTVGNTDSRITKAGRFLRKYKIDELPQLLNVFLGSMSMVGPRPEVRKYVAMYTKEQQKILMIKPGITDYASMEYLDENELLGISDDPEKLYITEVMPAKLALNLKYIEDMGLMTDFRIILKTVKKILR